MALWFGFAAVAGAFGGLLAFGVQHIHSSVQNWRLLFIIEVSPTVFNQLNHGSSLPFPYYVGYTSRVTGYRNYIPPSGQTRVDNLFNGERA